jgi:HSP90 family molecular chaperone
VYDKFYGSSANNMTQIHNIAKDGVAYEFLLFDPDSQSPGQFNKLAAEMFSSRILITDDLADMMPSYRNFVENVTASDDPPPRISRPKRNQGR